MTRTTPSSPVGLHRVLEPSGALPQAATRLDATPEIWPDEVRVSVSVLNLDAASFRQLITKHDGDGEQVKREVLDIIADRGKMQMSICDVLRDSQLSNTTKLLQIRFGHLKITLALGRCQTF